MKAKLKLIDRSDRSCLDRTQPFESDSSQLNDWVSCWKAALRVGINQAILGSRQGDQMIL
jgi:hypothetical protein